jgi:hypothetical protein
MKCNNCGEDFSYSMNDLIRIDTLNFDECNKCLSHKYLGWLKKVSNEIPK